MIAEKKRVTVEFQSIDAHVPLLFAGRAGAAAGTGLLRRLNPFGGLRRRIASQMGLSSAQGSSATHRQVGWE